MCNEDLCDKPSYVRGMCKTHYSRFRRREGLIPGRECSDETCDKPVESAKLCTLHYSRVSRKDADSPRCDYEKCSRPAEIKGLCLGHYGQQYRGKKLTPLGPLALKPRVIIGKWGKWRRDSKGYVARSKRNPDGSNTYQTQHRFVMEEALGRKLEGSENVHHLNGDRSDNRIENLELWEVSQVSGQRVRDKIREAHRIFALYGEDDSLY